MDPMVLWEWEQGDLKKNASCIQSFATSHDDDMISKKLICMKKHVVQNVYIHGNLGKSLESSFKL